MMPRVNSREVGVLRRQARSSGFRFVRALLVACASALVCAAQAVPRLGDPLPASTFASAPRALVVVYSHDCGDLGDLWTALLRQKLPLRVVNAEDIPAPAPGALEVWRGREATAFSRALRIRRYPTVLYVEDGRITAFWEGQKNDPQGGTKFMRFLEPLKVD